MPLIPVRDLARRTREVLDEVERSGRVTIVTRQGRPAVALVPIDAADLEDFVLASARDYLTAMTDADADLSRGRTRPLEELVARPAGARKAGSGSQRKPVTARSSSRR